MARRLPFIALSAALAACATLSVSSYIHPAADFSRYQTYDWGPRDALPTGDPRLDNNPFFDSQVRASVERELAAQGYRRVDIEGVINHQSRMEQRVKEVTQKILERFPPRS
ncbi:MAG: DUF4136 domain-containing protein [Gemmatimonadetes bacterium]|nr:DUF4136 domain-containing protein [Gemmatimonadota bacterium]